MAAPSPGAAKALGRAVSGFVEETWAERRLQIVADGNEAKFGQNPELRGFLAKTGDRVLVEASPTDRIWGIGLAEDDPRANDPLSWRGRRSMSRATLRRESDDKRGRHIA